MQDAQLHTILRLPVGTFTPYSPGVKANVFFFRKGLPTEEVWFYDLRTNVPKVTKSQPLTEDSFADFVRAFGSDPTPKAGSRTETDRFRCFSRADLAKRDDNLDIFWLKDENLDDPNELPEPEDLLGEAMTQLETAVDALNELGRILGNGNGREA
jgi:type I restriction enzyme M protein